MKPLVIARSVHSFTYDLVTSSARTILDFIGSELDVKHINGGRALPKLSRPPGLAHQFLKEDGTPYDMSIGVWTGQGRAEQLHVASQPALIGTGTVVVDAVLAIASYSWIATADFGTIGRFRIVLWVGNGTERLGSTIYEWDVADAPGADPTV